MNAPPRPDAVASIAVVVPILNEADTIAAQLSDLSRHGFADIVVADGGSDDGSLEVVAAVAGARLLQTTRGRGLQLNAGAAVIQADVIVFLHADTRLPDDACDYIRGVLSDASVVAGCFKLSFDSKHPLLWLYAKATAVNTFFTTFGDQAFFMRASAFRDVGGFPDWPLLEDVELRRRLMRKGKFVKANAQVVTSARRFRSGGVLRQQLMNAAILCAFRAGVPAERLANWYAPRSAKSPER